ncbi:hypothetical protein LCGC14_0688090 [marine sediment metagenome]|uniref:Uncharacterized protein n=1 Tax=marine sediment metagenome TaxID=412755 RepID=A0A0F9T7I3_9ZZZZ
MGEFEVTFIYKVKVESEASLNYKEEREKVIVKARKIHEEQVRNAGSVDAKISEVRDLVWANEIAPLIGLKNRLIGRLRVDERGQPIPEGKIRRGIADQIVEITKDLEQYPQWRRQNN